MKEIEKEKALANLSEIWKMIGEEEEEEKNPVT